MRNPFKPYTIQEAKEACKDHLIVRSNVKIAVIDDKGFAVIEGLRKAGFHINHYHDIDSVYTIQPYDIVICDIKGVGKSYGSSFEGAFLMSEIYKNYPSKCLIAYSGYTFNTQFNEYFSLSDFIVAKTADVSQWVEVLEEAIVFLSNPERQWDKMKKYLKEQKVPANVVLDLEKSYAKSIVKKDQGYFKKAATDGLKKISTEIVQVVINSITNAIVNQIK
jgi:hypothetical protein